MRRLDGHFQLTGGVVKENVQIKAENGTRNGKFDELGK
jgi:hypothetical protein